MRRRPRQTLPRHRHAGRRSTALAWLAALVALLAACSDAPEVSDERGLWENVDDEEPDLSGLRRADLALTSSVVDRDGTTFTIAGSLVSLDKSFVIGPVVTVALAEGVSLDPVPDGCTTDGPDRFECGFFETLEIDASPPTEPVEFRSR